MAGFRELAENATSYQWTDTAMSSQILDENGEEETIEPPAKDQDLGITGMGSIDGIQQHRSTCLPPSIELVNHILSTIPPERGPVSAIPVEQAFQRTFPYLDQYSRVKVSTDRAETIRITCCSWSELSRTRLAHPLHYSTSFDRELHADVAHGSIPSP
ncbi:hypothetical protein K504DRAFT_505874 [Pleomassaria siparia CBS 279.74]|uniref:Uncharacterized protein n=1 Tax=Pleomassaria siparia CBS 279.74 TaxID=1314801 RepID=A0A6G1JY52_9PLEO|nr:hypothetical protein K504DRAFT_505874 [Pleomassaria siparia CBS 279.74]